MVEKAGWTGLVVGILVGMFIALVLMPTPAEAHVPESRMMSHCAEDEAFLLGDGDFGNGHWSTYKCVHPEKIADIARNDHAIARGLVEGICEGNRRFFKRQFGLTVMPEGCEIAGSH